MLVDRGMAAAVIAAMLLSIGCGSRVLSENRYGIKSIALAGGQKVYLKRQVGTIFFDRTSLSQNGDRCVGPDDDSDYLLTSVGAGEFPLYYAVSPNGLIVYDSEIQPPLHRAWTLVVKQQQLSSEPHFGRRDEDYFAKGASKAQLPLDELRSCE